LIFLFCLVKFLFSLFLCLLLVIKSVNRDHQYTGMVAQWKAIGLTFKRSRVQFPAGAWLHDYSGQLVYTHEGYRHIGHGPVWLGKDFTFST